MLRIRQEQVDALDLAREDDFIRRTMLHVRQLFAGRRFENEPLRALIDAGIRKANAYALPAERDTALLVDLMVALGADFDLQPENAALAAVLNDRELTGESRIDLVFELVRLRPAGPAEELEAEE